MVEDRQLSDICTNCPGMCCQAIKLNVKPGDKMRQLLGVHYGRNPDSIEVVQVQLHHRCPHQDDNGKCDLWRENPEEDQRPPYCQEYLCDMALNPGVLIVEVEG